MRTNQRHILTILITILAIHCKHGSSLLSSEVSGYTNKLNTADDFKSYAGKINNFQAVKFTIKNLVSGQPIYFQNTSKYPYHINFLKSELPEYKLMSLEEYTRAIFGVAGGPPKELSGGTLMYSSSYKITADGPSGAIGFDYYMGDEGSPLTGDVVIKNFDYIKAAYQKLTATIPFVGGRIGPFLPPALRFNNAKMIALFKEANIPILWQTESVLKQFYGLENANEQVLNPGVSYGVLKRMSPQELAKAVVSFKDILVLTKLPLDLPVVGGTITEELQTPLSHVNIAARNRGTPNMMLVNAGNDARVKDLFGKLVRFETKDGAFSLREVSLDEANAFWRDSRPKLYTPEHDDQATGLIDFDKLAFADSKFVGVKAANLAEIYHVLGSSGLAPKGFGVPFSYYLNFMQSSQVDSSLCTQAKADCPTSGRAAAVCEKAYQLCNNFSHGGAEKLTDYVSRVISDKGFNSDSLLRDAALHGIRFHMTHIPVSRDFAALLDNHIVALFGSAKIKLRSSTNSEDLPNFSGAGLYDSFSGYGSGAKHLAHEQIRLTWASVWNYRAFEERSYWNIDHMNVRMGVAVQISYEDEVANGVLITQNIANPSEPGMYVNAQKGDGSVTKPENGELPEIFSVIPGPSGDLQVKRTRLSSLSPAQPLLSQQEIEKLYRAAYRLQQHFAPLYKKDERELALDMEFKAFGPNRQINIKQARPFAQKSGF